MKRYRITRVHDLVTCQVENNGETQELIPRGRRSLRFDFGGVDQHSQELGHAILSDYFGEFPNKMTMYLGEDEASKHVHPFVWAMIFPMYAWDQFTIPKNVIERFISERMNNG